MQPADPKKTLIHQAGSGPMTLAELKRVFEVELSNDFLRRALDELRADWQERGVELVQIADGWRFHGLPWTQD